MTAAAIEYRRIEPPPAFVSTDRRREARMMPPSAAISEQIAKTVILIRSTLMPARRAASWLPPTAYTYRPNFVLRATQVQKTRSAPTSTATYGTPRSWLAT